MRGAMDCRQSSETQNGKGYASVFDELANQRDQQAKTNDADGKHQHQSKQGDQILNIQQAEDFLSNYAFVAFPSVRTWLRSTDHADSTFDMWAKALTKLEVAECRDVIDAWVAGDLEQPAYLRDSFPYHIRGCVNQRRRASMAKDAMQSHWQATRRTSAMQDVVQTDSLWNEFWEPLRKAVVEGQMTKAAALAEWNQILDAEFNKRGHR